MSGYRCVNYYDLCRMCTTSTGTRIHIFSAEGKKKNLYQKILECLPVVVDEKDKLPKILCGSCLQQIESIAEFRNICLNSQTMLESCLNSTTLQNGGKVYIKDATTQKVVTTTQNIVKSEPVTVTNATTQSTDFLSSIIQAVGIQSTDDSGTDNRTQIIPQYTVTIDGKAIKTGQVEYKVEETSQAQSERQAKQNSLAEFLKMKPNIRVTPIPKKKDPTPAPPPQQTMTVPIQHPVQIKAETPKAKKPKYNIVLASPAQQKTTLIPATSGPTSTGAKTVSLQDLKILSSNKCFLPITIKDSNSDQQIVAQIDTKNLVLPTTYHLQMKLQPQIATVDGQPIVQLTPTAIPATLSLAPTQTLTTQSYQTDQQTHNSHIISSGIDASTSTNDTEIIFTSGQLQNHHQVPANSITFQQFQPSANVQTTTTTMPKLQIVPTSLAQNNPQIQVHHTKPQNTITVQRITTQQAQIHQQQQQQQHHHHQQAQQQQQQQNQQQHQQTQPQQHHQQTHHQQHQQQQQQQQHTIVQKIKTEPSTTTTVTTQVQPPQQAKTTVTAKAKAQTIAVGGGGGGAVATAGQLQVKTDGSAQECTICGRAFKKKEHLAQHMKLHAGLRPFKCKEVGCNKSFSRKEHLMRHLVSHTGKKMFSCDLCQKLFSRKDNLNKHKRTHSEQGATQNGQFVCEICNKTFVVKMYYQQHKAMHEQKGQTTPIKGKVEKGEKNSSTSSIESKPIIETMQTTANINQGNQQIMQLQISPTVVSTSSISNQSQQQQTTTAVLKTLGSHDTTVLNLPSNLSNLISINSAQFMTTGELLGQFKIENEFPTIQWQEIGHKTTSDR